MVLKEKTVTFLFHNFDGLNVEENEVKINSKDESFFAFYLAPYHYSDVRNSSALKRGRVLRGWLWNFGFHI